MTYEDFAKKFIEVASEQPERSNEDFTHKQAIEISWMAFNRLLVSKGLGVLPLDPIQDVCYNLEDEGNNE